MGETDIANCLFKSIENGDIDAVRELYHEDLVVWHNFDGLDCREKGQSKEENLHSISSLPSFIDNLRYNVLQREVTASGFVQQHVLEGVLPNGESIAIPACIIVSIANGHISRIDEYMDSADLAPLMEFLPDSSAQ